MLNQEVSGIFFRGTRGPGKDEAQAYKDMAKAFKQTFKDLGLIDAYNSMAPSYINITNGGTVLNNETNAPNVKTDVNNNFTAGGAGGASGEFPSSSGD
jgi:hypothetical protein